MSLPTWLEPLPDAAAQRAIDAWAITELGIPGETLMERAGAGLAEQAAKLVPDGVVAVVCGKGNNGGDGFVAARVLREQGREVQVLLLAEPAEYEGDARTNLERLGADAQAFTSEALNEATLIIDAVLGTGFSGELRAPASDAITAINAAREAGGGNVRVVACDVPSGVDASTGEASEGAVSADLTVTFHASKPGLWIHPGKRHARRNRVIDLGISAEPPAEIEVSIGRLGPAVRDEIPRRGLHSNKFTAGAVLVCGGSRGLTGAPIMSAMAAARAGAGYVTVAVPESIAETVESKLLEIMTVALPDTAEAGLKRGTSRMLVERSARAQALVLGPGLGRLTATTNFVRAVAQYANVPLVLDADGLNAHAEAGALEVLQQRKAPTVLTPHAGELGRILQTDTAAIDERRLEHVQLAAARAGAVVVLKGDDTLIASPDGTVAVSPGAAPALATAGTGDVLSGIIAAFLAKGTDPFTAACAGVDTHLRAGRLAAKLIGPEGVIAGDVIGAVPKVLAQGPRGGES